MNFSDQLKWHLLNYLIKIKFPTVNTISTEELATWLEDKHRKDPLLFDARTPLEYFISHLHGAYFIPSKSIELENTIEDSSTPIVTYCSVGYRSAILARKLQKMGYKQVFNLEGSLFAWFSENRPVFCDDKIVSSIHPYNLFWSLWL